MKHASYYCCFLVLLNFQTLTAQCPVVWQDGVFGSCIGGNESLIPYDFGNDGTTELIANGRTYNSNTGVGLGFWYILKFNPATYKYSKIYISPFFDDPISKLELIDIGSDGNKELVVGTENWLHIVDLNTLNTIQSIELNPSQFSLTIRHIKEADVDNDGENEIVVSADESLVVISETNLNVEFTYIIEAGYFDVGNVDEDSELELVFSNGMIYQINSAGELNPQYDFLPSSTLLYSRIELSDIDQDGIKEAFVRDGSYLITSYNLVTGMAINSITTTITPSVLTMKDINNDGIDELFYGGSSDEEIYCCNAVTGAQLWSITSGDIGVTGIVIGNFDNEPSLEVVWSAGCGSSGADHLYINSVATQYLEWKNVDTSGPYYAIEIGDVDEDGQQEIVTMSYGSDSGYGSGILTIYNAVTKNIEFQSTPIFLYLTWTGVYNVEIVDYANDGDMDIIVASGEGYTGKIWVIDGNTHTIEFFHLFSAGSVNAFKALDIANIDSDATLEFIAANDNRVFIINSSNWVIQSESVNLSSSNHTTGVLVGNIDADVSKEIVLCKGIIFTLDNQANVQGQSTYDEYLAIKLYDWDDDGDMEILAGTSYGNFVVLDGNSLDVVATFELGNEPVGGIEIADINGDDEEEFLVTSGKRIYTLNKNGEFVSSNEIAYNLGEQDAIEITDFDGDGTLNIVLGTNFGLVELNPDCLVCSSFPVEINKIDPSCGLNNGLIFATSSDNTISISMNDFTYLDTLKHLNSGDYFITARNDSGCLQGTNISLEQQILQATTTTINNSCESPADGQAYLNIQEGSPPFVYNWSNGQMTDTTYNLSPGEYKVTLTDNNGCIYKDTFQINQSILLTDFMILKPSCTNLSNGEAIISIAVGVEPIEYYWDNLPGNNTLTTLSAGDHIVSVIDANGCTSADTFTIPATNLVIWTNPVSISCQGEETGSAEVNIVEGTPPFQYQWSNGWDASGNIENVAGGAFYVTVTDGNQCNAVDSVFIAASDIQITSQIQHLLCHGNTDGSAIIAANGGYPPYTYQWDNGLISDTLTGVSAGTYYLFIVDSIGCNVIETIEILSPAALETSFNVTDDFLETPELEGTIEAIVAGGTPPYFYLWDFGSTLPLVEDLGAGIYHLQITDDHGCTQDTLVQLSVVSDLSNIPFDFIKLYPNPAFNVITLEFRDQIFSDNITMFDSGGKQVALEIRGTTSPDKWEIDLTDLPSGIYYMIFYINNGFCYKKIDIVK